MSRVIVNGLEYEKVQNPKRDSKFTYIEYLLSQFYTQMNAGKSPKPNVNLVDEFELIQNKQSKLSRANRDWVVSISANKNRAFFICIFFIMLKLVIKF